MTWPNGGYSGGGDGGSMRPPAQRLRYRQPSPRRCDCCDLPVESCGRDAERRQRVADARERQRLLSQAGARPARYPGACGRCGEHYAAADIIGPPRTAGDPWVGPCCLGAA